MPVTRPYLVPDEDDRPSDSDDGDLYMFNYGMSQYAGIC